MTPGWPGLPDQASWPLLLGGLLAHNANKLTVLRRFLTGGGGRRLTSKQCCEAQPLRPPARQGTDTACNIADAGRYL